ncbi:NlpC/P60 family protein [Flavobacterium sp.]|uniref:peptidoglycan endopeptidase n=1 Tax=Flavobacterium sp. TaxID=239 RepID=UPI00374CD4DB
MKYFKFILLIFISVNAFSQEKNIKHIVARGESIYQIAKKYNVNQDDIFKLNPNTKSVLKLNSVLLIPKSISENSENVSNIIHEVLPKQTLYGISKQYKVSIDDIKKANPIIEKEGLEVGLKLTIPQNGFKSKVAILTENISEPIKQIEPENPIRVSNEQEIIHVVLPKETKYGISKRYKISIQELEKLNPKIGSDFPVGFNLLIKKGVAKEVATTEIPVDKNSEEIKLQIEEEKQIQNQESSQIKVVEVIPHKEEEVVSVPPLSEENASKADKLVMTASENIGVRYRSGGTTKDGFDCSGLMINTFSTYDVRLPRTSSEMSRFGTTINASEAQKGDLIFFSTNGTGNVNHVGMITEVVADEVKFVHSSVHAGVIISSNKEAYYAKRFVKINRVLE